MYYFFLDKEFFSSTFICGLILKIYCNAEKKIITRWLRTSLTTYLKKLHVFKILCYAKFG